MLHATQLPLSSKAAAVFGDARSCRRAARAPHCGKRGATSVQAVLSEDLSLAPELQEGFNPIDPNKTGRLISVRSLRSETPPVGPLSLIFQS